ncbi:hypothetical protein BBK82_21960 [Lentzea guizhouensis]|uniref:Novel STAND NTPase 1 domain-containing protein n=1 Tax=Lentzea guizhouensis TaxID=1586287 RepID=A0A1B2HKT8_9PSEU|nr:AAA family ATPase [Lentzea guizhouensis]ANZ38334.1 hypothetical protein BBK82_21960 [Lentzea guizhouensis]
MGRIFVSYHGHDEGDIIALHLREALLTAGYEDVHAYTAPGSGPTVSLPWKDSLRRELLGAEALIVVTSPGSSSEWCIWETSVFRERKPLSPCIEFFSGSQGRAVLNDLQAHRVDAADPVSLAAARDTVLQALARAGVGKAAGTTSPFPGLKPFDEHQASLFFGRENDIQRLAEPLLGRRESGALAVIGPSGAGKSSLVRAGLIPLLRREGWTIAGPVTPSHGVLPPIERPGRTLVVLDQAEELLSGATDRLAPQAAALVERLVEASRGKAWVVYTVRSDFLDELMRQAEIEPLLRDDFLVTPLTKADLPMVVNGPLRGLGWHVDDAALGLIQEDATGESLPLLAFALENLWRHVNPDGLRPPRPITRAEYVASGRVMDVLRRQADEAFALARDLVRDQDGSWPPVREAERRVLRTLRRLVAVDESGKFTRRALRMHDLRAQDRQVLDPFITNRVLTTTRQTLQVAHESLFVHWPRFREELERDHAVLRVWREVEDVAAEWTKHSDQLIAPSRLATLLGVLSPPESKFAELWPHLEETLTALDFTRDAVGLLRQSIQLWADTEVHRASALEPRDTLRMLAGDDLTVWLFLHAPDLSGWRQALLHAMAATHLLRAVLSRNAVAVRWSPDDALLVTGSNECTVRTWNADSGERQDDLRDAAGPIGSIAWSQTNVITTSAVGDVLRLSSTHAERTTRTFKLPSPPVSARLTSTGEHVLVAYPNGSVHLREVGNQHHDPADVHWCVAEDDPVGLRDADLSPDGNWIAGARDDGTISVIGFDQPAGRERRLEGRADGLRRVRWSPQGTRLATGSADGAVHVWDAVSGKVVLKLRGHERGVLDLEWSHRGDRLTTVAEDGVHRVWKIGSEPHRSGFRTGGPVGSLAWHPLDRKLVVGSAATSAVGLISTPWTTAVNRDSVTFTNHPARFAAWRPDGSRFAAGAGTTVQLVDGDFGQLRHLFDAGDLVQDGHWSRDGSLLAVVSIDRSRLPWVYDADGHLQRSPQWTKHTGTLRAVAWHPVQELFAVAGEDNLITLNSMSATCCTFRAPRKFTSLAWHPDGALLAAGCADGTTILLRLTDVLTEETQLRGHLDEITSTAWSPDGRSLLTASKDCTARVWDPVTGGQRTALIGHSDAVQAALWSPDGLAVTGSADCTVRYWDTSDGTTHPLAGTAESTDVQDLVAEARKRISPR